MANVINLEPGYFPDFTKGKPVSNGYIYVGVIDKDPEDFPKQVSALQENGTTVEISQPVRTSSGGVPTYNGSPITLLVDGSYSLRVRNSAGVQVYYVPKNAEETDKLVTVNTIADLRILSGSFENQSATVLGYYSVGDGGGGPLRTWHTGQAAGFYVDNGGSIIVPTGGDESEAWLTPITNVFNVNLFGAKGDGSTDDYTAIINAMAVLSSVGGGRLVFEKGVYLTNSNIEIPSNIILDLSLGATIRRNFNTSTGGVGLFTLSNNSENISILGGTLDGNGVNFDANSFNILTATGINNLTIEGTVFLDVIDFHAVDFTDADDIIIRDCKFMGFYLKDGARDFSEAIQIDPGYSTTAGYGFVKNVLVDNCYFGENPDNIDPNFVSWPAGVGNHSANITGITVENIKVVNCVFDSLTYAGVVPYAWNGVVISSNNFESCNRGIYINRGTGTLEVGTENCVIDGNTFNNTTLADIHIRNTDSGVGTWFSKNITVSNNTSKESAKFIVSYYADGLTVVGNTYEGKSDFLSEFITLQADFFNKNKNIVVSSNYASILNVFAFAGLDFENITISLNTINNLNGRGIHLTGTGTRSNISITDNTIVDCAGISYIGVDTSVVNNCIVNNNKMLIGTESKSISDVSSIIVSQASTSVYILDNTIDVTLIAKRVFSPYGIVKTLVSGTPEGALTAAPGSSCIDITNGKLYTKGSGNGSTGWVEK